MKVRESKLFFRSFFSGLEKSVTEKRWKVLTSFLFFSYLFLLVGISFANDDLIKKLLKLPAPPPQNPFVKISITAARDISFYDAKEPPPDDAPIEDILDYWKYWNSLSKSIEGRFCPKPSMKVLERIKNEIRNDVSLLLSYIELLKDNVELVKEIYDEELISKRQSRWWRKNVRDWLVYNSKYFISDLFDLTQQNLAETETYVQGREELQALAKFDWEKANLIIQRLIADSTKPGLQTLAKWVLYKHLLETGDEREAERLREELKKIVADRQQKPGVRDLALDALLMEKEFPGRDDWYFSLLNDETLLNLRDGSTNFTGLKTLIRLSEPGKYKNRLLELLRSDKKTVSLAAAFILLSDEAQVDEKTVKALLPLLNDLDFDRSSDEIRKEVERSLIQRLSIIKVPESVPSLISVLQERLRGYDQTDYDLNQQIYNIVDALGRQADPRAIPLLWKVFSTTKETWRKEAVLKALLRCGSFSVSEKVDAIEKKLSTEMRMGVQPLEDLLKKLTPTNQIKFILGSAILSESENFDDELVLAILERIKLLKKTNPNLAIEMRKMLIKQRVTSLNPILLWELGENSIDLEGVLRLLVERKEIRQRYLDEVYAIRDKNPLAEGISACLLEGDYKRILEEGQVQAKAALLACGRLIRASFPIEDVAVLLKTENKLLFDAAVKYLESEDSSQARQMVWSLYPGEAKILGANPYFGDEPPDELFDLVFELFQSISPYYSVYLDLHLRKSAVKSLKEEEEALRKEILEKDDLLGIYAYKDNIVRIYKDKAVFTWKKNKDFYIERVLQLEEFERLKKHIAESNVDLLPPFFEECEECGECPYSVSELLMLGKGGGRRVFVIISECAELPKFKFFADLEKIFEDFREKHGKVKYAFQDSLPGFELLYSDGNFKVEGVWKKGNDLRVLVKEESRMRKIEEETEEKLDVLTERGKIDGDEEYEQVLKQREQLIAATYLWRRYENGDLKELVPHPEGFDFSPHFLSSRKPGDVEEWKRKTSPFSLLVDSGWLIKKDLSSGKEERLLQVDLYNSQPVISADGRWALMITGEKLVKYDLQKRAVFQIPLDDAMKYSLQVLVYVPELGKFLLGRQYLIDEYYEEMESILGDTAKFGYKLTEKFYLFDVTNNSFQAVDKRAMPLAQQTWRPLQPFMGRADQFWVADPDLKNRKTVIGVFNVRNFQFRPLMELPKIVFDSMDMWVDEQDRKIYIAHGGNLLRIPLP